MARKYKKKTEKEKMINKLDKLWAKVIYQKGNYQCEVCGRTNCLLNAHHINGRSPKQIRWDSDNGICLCAGCHTLGGVSAHSVSYQGQKEFHKILEDLRGKKLLDILKLKKRQPSVNYSLDDLELIYQNLKQELNEGIT